MGDITMDTKDMDLYYLDPSTGEYKKINRVDISNQTVEIDAEENDETTENPVKEINYKIDIRDGVGFFQRLARLTDMDISKLAAICAYEFGTLTIECESGEPCPSDIFCNFVDSCRDPFIATLIDVLVNNCDKDSPYGNNLYFEKVLRLWRKSAKTICDVFEYEEIQNIFAEFTNTFNVYKRDILRASEFETTKKAEGVLAKIKKNGF